MAQPDNRKDDLARIHILKKELGLSDDEYRGLLSSVCGAASSGNLNQAGRALFLAHLGRLKVALGKGRPRAAKSARPKLAPRIGKMFSLWQQLYEARKVEKRTYAALEAWVQGQTKVDKLEWLTVAQQDQCIESLKKWLSRKGAA